METPTEDEMSFDDVLVAQDIAHDAMPERKILSSRPPKKPTIPEVQPLVVALYRRDPVGCCLHIVLDDQNVSQGDVEFCLAEARQVGHVECERLARLLLQMSKTQRLKLASAL